jgi:predicted  nucleic acid-binding Zn-ribbon protein
MYRLRPAVPWLGAAGLFVAATALAADPIESLAEKLVNLRSEVESLYDRIESSRRDHRNQMSAGAQRKAELESRVQRQQLEIRKLNRKLAEIRGSMDSASKQSSSIEPFVEEVAERLTTRPKTSALGGDLS